MTKADLIKLKEALLMVKEMGIVKPEEGIAIHSAWTEQTEAMKYVFGNTVKVLSKNEWDIKDGKLKSVLGLLVFCNVFMYIDQPAIAFGNVLGSCKYLLIQDIIIRNRGLNIFGGDGDCMRYEYHEYHELNELNTNYAKSNYTKAFDIGKAGKVIKFMPYVDDIVNMHFIALMRKYELHEL